MEPREQDVEVYRFDEPPPIAWARSRHGFVNLWMQSVALNLWTAEMAWLAAMGMLYCADHGEVTLPVGHQSA